MTQEYRPQKTGTQGDKEVQEIHDTGDPEDRRSTRQGETGDPEDKERSETIAKTEEEVVGRFRVADLETDMEEGVVGYEGLEGGDVVEAAELWAFVDDIVADTYVHGEDRSLELCTERNTGCKLLSERRPVELDDVSDRVDTRHIIDQVHSLVILNVN